MSRKADRKGRSQRQIAKKEQAQPKAAYSGPPLAIQPPSTGITAPLIQAAPASLFHQKAKAVCVSKFCDAVEVGHQPVRMVLFRPGEGIIKRWANGRRVGIENCHIEPLQGRLVRVQKPPQEGEVDCADKPLVSGLLAVLAIIPMGWRQIRR